MRKIRSCFFRPLIFVDVLFFGDLDELGHAHPLQLGDVDVAVGLVGARCCADAADALGGLVEFFGERQRFFVLELGQTLAVDLDRHCRWGRLRRCMGRGRLCRVSRFAKSAMRFSLLEEMRAVARGRRRGVGFQNRRGISGGQRERPTVRCLSEPLLHTG